MSPPSLYMNMSPQRIDKAIGPRERIDKAGFSFLMAMKGMKARPLR